MQVNTKDVPPQENIPEAWLVGSLVPLPLELHPLHPIVVVMVQASIPDSDPFELLTLEIADTV